MICWANGLAACGSFPRSGPEGLVMRAGSVGGLGGAILGLGMFNWSN